MSAGKPIWYMNEFSIYQVSTQVIIFKFLFS